MYIKWILRQRNPIARKNISYLFFLCNNKELRAVDSGIYACLKTSKMKTIKAKTFLEKLKRNDQKLEANLSTLLSSIRGTKQYWSRINGRSGSNGRVFGSSYIFSHIELRRI